jgi:sugar-specific transcriptional regulator TrmB
LPLRNKNLDLFIQLGLTLQEVRVYIALCELGQATVRTIAKTAQIDRAEIYRVTPRLEALGLIKRIIKVPISFSAVPLSEGISILLQRNAEKHKEITAKANRLLHTFRSKQQDPDYHYYLKSGQSAESAEFLRKLRESQTSKDGIFEWKKALHIFCKFAEDYKEALGRGIKMRYITNIPEGEKKPQTIQTFEETGYFEIRSSSFVPTAHLTVGDKKIVALIVIPNSDMKKIEVLRSENPAIVELSLDYFEMKWQSAKPPKWG